MFIYHKWEIFHQYRIY